MIDIFYVFLKVVHHLQVGQAVHVGCLLRLDLNQASVETIYVTVWASPSVSLHLGKIENADDFWGNHVGVRLQVSLYTLALILLTRTCLSGSSAEGDGLHNFCHRP